MYHREPPSLKRPKCTKFSHFPTLDPGNLSNNASSHTPILRQFGSINGNNLSVTVLMSPSATPSVSPNNPPRSRRKFGTTEAKNWYTKQTSARGLARISTAISRPPEKCSEEYLTYIKTQFPFFGGVNYPLDSPNPHLQNN